MRAANDVFSAEGELLGLVVNAKFLLAMLDRYDRDPNAENWQGVCLAREWVNDSCEQSEPLRTSYLKGQPTAAGGQ